MLTVLLLAVMCGQMKLKELILRACLHGMNFVATSESSFHVALHISFNNVRAMFFE